jgi:tetratricopeptide (TPR) repeat protein
MLPYYYGDPAEAVNLARAAQGILGNLPKDSGALAAAAEARALARLGDSSQALEAIARAESLVESLDEPDSDEALRFGIRRLLFYSSGTYSNLGDVSRAARVQDEALTTYGDKAGLIDPALIRLDRAQVLIAHGDVTRRPSGSISRSPAPYPLLTSGNPFVNCTHSRGRRKRYPHCPSSTRSPRSSTPSTTKSS